MSRGMSRGTGRTSVQMKYSPENAYYVWPTEYSRKYPVMLAEFLNRKDLKHCTLGQLFVSDFWRGRDGVFILDHACYEFMTGENMSKLYELRGVGLDVRF